MRAQVRRAARRTAAWRTAPRRPQRVVRRCRSPSRTRGCRRLLRSQRVPCHDPRPRPVSSFRARCTPGSRRRGAPPSRGSAGPSPGRLGPPGSIPARASIPRLRPRRPGRRGRTRLWPRNGGRVQIHAACSSSAPSEEERARTGHRTYRRAERRGHQRPPACRASWPSTPHSPARSARGARVAACSREISRRRADRAAFGQPRLSNSPAIAAKKTRSSTNRLPATARRLESLSACLRDWKTKVLVTAITPPVVHTSKRAEVLHDVQAVGGSRCPVSRRASNTAREAGPVGRHQTAASASPRSSVLPVLRGRSRDLIRSVSGVIGRSAASITDTPGWTTAISG